MKVTMLGCGTSSGVPAIGCHCAVCSSNDPRNKRTRSSIYVKWGDTSLVIDTTPEFRIQVLREKIEGLDMVLYTHDHADHLHGLDDLRPFCYNKAIPVYGTGDLLKELQCRFSYIFRETQRGGGKPRLDLREIPREGFSKDGVKIIPIPVFHGKLPILGYRIGSMAYITDCSQIPKESYALLHDLELLIIGALRYRPHETHFSVDQALAEVKKIRPRRASFTHLNHDLDYQELSNGLPPHIQVGRDGLSWDLA